MYSTIHFKFENIVLRPGENRHQHGSNHPTVKEWNTDDYAEYTEWEVLHTHVVGEGNGDPLQYSCLENPMDGGAWLAAVYGVAQSRTQRKRYSSSSSTHPRYYSLKNL